MCRLYVRVFHKNVNGVGAVSQMTHNDLFKPTVVSCIKNMF